VAPILSCVYIMCMAPILICVVVVQAILSHEQKRAETGRSSNTASNAWKRFKHVLYIQG